MHCGRHDLCHAAAFGKSGGKVTSLFSDAGEFVPERVYRSTKSETSAPPVGACFPVPKRIARQQFHKVQLAPYRSESPMSVEKDICLGKDVIDAVVQSCEIPEKVRERGLEEMIAQ